MRLSSLLFAVTVLAGTQTLTSRAALAVDVLASALTGGSDQEYGVATIEVPLATPIIGKPPAPLTVDGPPGRVFFPVANDVEARITPASERPVPQPGQGRLLGRLGKLIREIADPDAPQTQITSRRIQFLFKGDTPLRVRLADGNGEIGVYELKPVNDPPTFNQMLVSWWNHFTTDAKQQIENGDYPPWVQTYLVAMLSGRTGNGLPDWFVQPREQDDLLLTTLKYLAGAEDVAKEIYRRTAAGLNDADRPRQVGAGEQASLPIPAGPRWVDTVLPEIDPDVQTEPIASRVPPECFYLRFGTFENYLWFLDLTQEYGGDLGRMITVRGTAGESTQRFQNQIAVKINQLTRMLGPTVVEDQAVIGSDLFTSDGATMGVLMKSKNAFLMRTSLANDRSQRASADPDVTKTTVTIAGNSVSLLSKPDNSVRSFLAEDGGYFLISNSEALVERFFEVGKSKQSLASTKSFRLSRMLVPTSRDDTIFAYFSPQMLQNLVSPEYMIELRRRKSAASEIALVHLARLAAIKESGGTAVANELGVETLIEKGFLPVSFGNRGDGSGVITLGDEVIDTLRGARGTFLPIRDVTLEGVTAEESRWYSQIAQAYSERFPQMDPIIVALRRDDVPGDASLERLSIHAEIAPLTPEKYGKWSKQLGPPTEVGMRFAPDDIVSLQAHVESEQIGPPTHLFVGIKDSFPPAPEQFDGFLKTYRAARQLPGYLGAWPQPGALDRLPLGLGRGRPVGPGMSKLLGGLYRYTGGGFSVLSFQPEVLESTLPFLEASDVGTPATVRGRVGSLLGSQLEGWVNNQLYQRAARSSLAGADFLNLLSAQLLVPQSEALQTAERVLGSPLQCSLGGRYQFNPETRRWRSDAWQGNRPAPNPPSDYVSPLLNWFRGGDFTMTQYADRLVADAQVIVARKKAE